MPWATQNLESKLEHLHYLSLAKYQRLKGHERRRQLQIVMLFFKHLYSGRNTQHGQRPKLKLRPDTVIAECAILVSIKICSNCETYGLLNHFNYKMTEGVTRNCGRIVRHAD